jgi:hypothetical protein
MNYTLRLTAAQHVALRQHLFPGDGNEAVALLLCGRRKGKDRHILTVRKLVVVPHDSCSERRPDRVSWPTGLVELLLQEAHGHGQAIVKVHSHTSEYRRFSSTDDVSDRRLFSSVWNFLEDELPHASVIMLPDGEMFGRVMAEGEAIAPLSQILDRGPADAAN